MAKKKSSVRVVYDPTEFAGKGFDGEIAQYMMKNRNTAIVGERRGVDLHVIEFSDIEDWRNYKNPYEK